MGLVQKTSASVNIPTKYSLFLRLLCKFKYGQGGNNGGGIGQYGVGGAASRPMAWNGGGSTKPPMVNNYLDSHGLNAGMGNSGQTTFPSVVDTKPMQAARMANYTRYSPGDWATSNMSHYNSADNSRNTSERIRNEAVRLLRDR